MCGGDALRNTTSFRLYYVEMGFQLGAFGWFWLAWIKGCVIVRGAQLRFWSAVTSAFIYVLAPNCGTIGASNRTVYNRRLPAERKVEGGWLLHFLRTVIVNDL